MRGVGGKPQTRYAQVAQHDRQVMSWDRVDVADAAASKLRADLGQQTPQQRQVHGLVVRGPAIHRLGQDVAFTREVGPALAQK